MYQLTTDRLFWCPIAKTIQRSRPLPLPPHTNLESLSLDDLMTVCRRHARTTRSLESSEPRLRAILDLKTNSPICCLGFLPGGTMSYVIHQDGKGSLWDICRARTGSSTATGDPCGGVHSAGHEPTKIVDFDVGWEVASVNWNIRREKENRDVLDFMATSV